jgi:hypothetical protein
MGTGDISCQIINATGVIASTAANGIQIVASGASAWYRSLVQSVRDWYSGCNTDGGFYIYDASAAATRIRIDTGGTVFVGAALNVAGGSTLTGQVNCGHRQHHVQHGDNNHLRSDPPTNRDRRQPGSPSQPRRPHDRLQQFRRHLIFASAEHGGWNFTVPTNAGRKT